MTETIEVTVSGVFKPNNDRKIGTWRVMPFFQWDGTPLHWGGSFKRIGFVAVKPNGEYLTEQNSATPDDIGLLWLFPTLDDALREVRPLAARARIRAI